MAAVPPRKAHSSLVRDELPARKEAKLPLGEARPVSTRGARAGRNAARHDLVFQKRDTISHEEARGPCGGADARSKRVGAEELVTAAQVGAARALSPGKGLVSELASRASGTCLTCCSARCGLLGRALLGREM